MNIQQKEPVNIQQMELMKMQKRSQINMQHCVPINIQHRDPVCYQEVFSLDMDILNNYNNYVEHVDKKETVSVRHLDEYIDMTGFLRL